VIVIDSCTFSADIRHSLKDLNMKRKTIYWILIVLVIVLVAGGIYVYDTFQAMGLQPVYVDETTASAVPEAATGLHAVAPGTSDWLNWRGPDFTGKSSMTGLKTDWSNGLTKLWEVDYLCSGKESMTWAAPVVKGNHLVIPGRSATHDLLFCLDAVSGELLWKAEIACKPGDAWGRSPRHSNDYGQPRIRFRPFGYPDLLDARGWKPGLEKRRDEGRWNNT